MFSLNIQGEEEEDGKVEGKRPKVSSRARFMLQREKRRHLAGKQSAKNKEKEKKKKENDAAPGGEVVEEKKKDADGEVEKEKGTVAVVVATAVEKMGEKKKKKESVEVVEKVESTTVSAGEVTKKEKKESVAVAGEKVKEVPASKDGASAKAAPALAEKRISAKTIEKSIPAKIASQKIEEIVSEKAEEPPTEESSVKPFGSRKNPRYPNAKEWEGIREKKRQEQDEIVPQNNRVLTKELESRSSEHIFPENYDKSNPFGALGLLPVLAQHVTTPPSEKEENGKHHIGLGFAKPTIVQMEAIPAILQGGDVIIQSETGSGKTLAYSLPIVNGMISFPQRIDRSQGPYAAVIAPTRELCLQIAEVLCAVLRPFHWIVCTSVVGGEKRKSEKARLRKGVNVLVATPGRLLDHLRNTVSMRYCLRHRPLSWLVFDEADRLMDSGFEKQIGEILTTLKELREPQTGSSEGDVIQKILVSATISPAVNRLVTDTFRSPRQISVATGGASEKKDATSPKASKAKTITKSGDEPDLFTTPKQLVQYFVLAESNERLVMLTSFIRRQLMQSGYTSRIVVFVSSRACAEFLQAILSKVEWPPKGTTRLYQPKKDETQQAKKDETQQATLTEESSSLPTTVGLSTKYWALHGSIKQQERRRFLKEFSKARSGVLVCTDVAARGLDLPMIDWIVQYDPPTEISEYVHRVGRTARSGNKGSALLFLRQSEQEYQKILAERGVRLMELKGESILSALVKNVDNLEVLLHQNGISVQKNPNGEHGGGRGKFVDIDAVVQLLQRIFEEMVNGSKKRSNGEDDDDNDVEGLDNDVKKKSDNNNSYSKGDPHLKELAMNAYLSFVSGYSVHTAETKHIFQTRALHLGQVAKSFALREPPRAVSSTVKARNKEKMQVAQARGAKRDLERTAKTQERAAKRFKNAIDGVNENMDDADSDGGGDNKKHGMNGFLPSAMVSEFGA